MTERENLIRTVQGRGADHVPFLMPFGPWGETVTRWKREGYDGGDLALLVGTDTVFAGVEGVNYGLCPVFPEAELMRTDKFVVFKNWQGITLRQTLDHDTIPEYLDYPVRDWDTWLAVKPRFAPDAPGRFGDIRAPRGDVVIQAGCYPYGLFGTARDLIGVEPLLFLFYDEPELIHDIFDTLTTLWLACYERVLEVTPIDRVHIWEDMSGCQGPLISPAMMDEFMLPHYRRIRDFCAERGIPIFSVDTDGNLDRMLPFMVEAGVNLIEPWEVAAGNDVVDLKRRYPKQFCPMGGIDKREVAKGRAAIDAELSRIAPALESGCFIPALDHLFHPEISFEDFLYFNRALRALCHGRR